MHATLNLTVALLALGVLGKASAGVEPSPRAFTDNTTYNVGSTVRLKVNLPLPENSTPAPVDLIATLRYAGQAKPLGEPVVLARAFIPAVPDYSTEYLDLWKVPLDTRTGRYEVDVAAREPGTDREVWGVPRAASFAVHRKVLRIEQVKLDKTFYTSGDPVACVVTLRNLTRRPLSGLRVEFSDRYWPWIAQSSDQGVPPVTTLEGSLSLSPTVEWKVASPRAGTAKTVTQPTVHQYAVVVWGHDRKNIYDIAFSPQIYIVPPGVHSQTPYPNHYLFPNLGSVNVSSYRAFRRGELNSAAIEIDRSHTMFDVHDEPRLAFSVSNPTDTPWRGVSIRVRLRSLGSAEFSNRLVAEKADLEPRMPPIKQEVKFAFPDGAGGLFSARVEVSDSSGEILATNTLELAANPLPKSILIFCGHEDDEMAHAGIIRAAVENDLPLHLVYFTSGDAGSCDRYYQRSCGPAEALNFGSLRMEEARAALGRLGVPREAIDFLGLPDGGSAQIWSRHVEISNPYLSVLLASDHAPYEGLARPNLPYARAAVVEAAKEFIRKFQPQVIYTGHPDERHVDHRTNNWFVVKALQEFEREGTLPPDLKLLVDQVYGPGPQEHAPYKYEKHVLNVTGEVMALAQEAGWFYQSQSGNRAQGNLRAFDQLPRTEVHWQVLDWEDHEGWNEKD